MNPQTCGQCGQLLGVNAAVCRACWQARNPQPPSAPRPAGPVAPPASPRPAAPPADSDGWNPHSGSLPANPFFKVLKIIASVIGIAGAAVAVLLIIYATLN